MLHITVVSLEICKANVEMPILAEVMSLLYQQTNSRDMVSGGAIGHEACLLGAAAASDGWESTAEENPGEELPGMDRRAMPLISAIYRTLKTILCFIKRPVCCSLGCTH